MSSFTGALAGFLSPGDSSSAKRPDGSKKSSHEIFLSNQLIPLTNRLQREIRARRFRVSPPDGYKFLLYFGLRFVHLNIDSSL